MIPAIPGQNRFTSVSLTTSELNSRKIKSLTINKRGRP
jgi:hypothetical protein